LVSRYRFNDANREFRQLEKSDDERVSRHARYGHAITLLSVIPKTARNITRAENLFRALAEGPDDAVTIRSIYYLGRIKALHQRDPDWEAAAQFYWRMIREWPEDPFTQLAIVKLATIRLYEPTSREEKLRRYGELKALERLLNLPAARRDYHYVLGVASLSLEISKEEALRHLIACVDAGIKTPRMRINMYCRIGVTAKQLGKFDLAHDYFMRFLREAPRDLRTRMIRDHLEEMAVMSASTSRETGSQ
jgi:tetratricopeptide (TPR) repeat protein